MPKMPEDFYEQKREQILDVAMSIALQKPLSHISMKDLIRTCGVSQGAIYHYFSGLDEIWIGLVDRFYRADDIKAHLRQVFEQQLSPQQTACRCLWELCENLRRTIPVYGKLIMELNTLIQANPVQYDALAHAEAVHPRLDEMLLLFEDWCREQIRAGSIVPRASLEQILLYLCSSYLGLRYHAAAMHLQPALSSEGLDKYLDMQLQSWQMTVLYLLGLEETNDTTQNKE